MKTFFRYIYSEQGEKKQAFEKLNRAVEQRDINVLGLKPIPGFTLSAQTVASESY
jgi:hypothetical protein